MPILRIRFKKLGANAMGMLKEFKEFAMRGNVMDMAVGVVIGGAFKTIVDALVKEVIMPPIGFLTGGIDFSEIVIPLNDKVSIGIGVFLNAVVSFLIVAFTIFIVIKQINRLNKLMAFEEEQAPPAPTKKKCEFCQTEISIKATRCPNCTSQLAASA